MVRSNQPLIERMTLVWHSWFATSEEASSARLMINQNWMMRRHALGNFHQLLLDVTIDPAMLLWLNSNTNYKGSPNENYGREMLELFTLGPQKWCRSRYAISRLPACSMCAAIARRAARPLRTARAARICSCSSTLRT
jgi:uncharacterized protein (DUF1800 family)